MKVVDGLQTHSSSGLATRISGIWWHQEKLTIDLELSRGDMQCFVALSRSTWPIWDLLTWGWTSPSGNLHRATDQRITNGGWVQPDSMGSWISTQCSWPFVFWRLESNSPWWQWQFRQGFGSSSCCEECFDSGGHRQEAIRRELCCASVRAPTNLWTLAHCATWMVGPGCIYLRML